LKIICPAIYQKKKNKVNSRKFGILMTWKFVVKDRNLKKITMGLECGRIGKEGKYRAAPLRIYFGSM
jgi:hypothetical protein